VLHKPESGADVFYLITTDYLYKYPSGNTISAALASPLSALSAELQAYPFINAALVSSLSSLAGFLYTPPGFQTRALGVVYKVIGSVAVPTYQRHYVARFADGVEVPLISISVRWGSTLVGSFELLVCAMPAPIRDMLIAKIQTEALLTLYEVLPGYDRVIFAAPLSSGRDVIFEGTNVMRLYGSSGFAVARKEWQLDRIISHSVTGIEDTLIIPTGKMIHPGDDVVLNFFKRRVSAVVYSIWGTQATMTLHCNHKLVV
jgi:hypothetical protein